MKVLVFIAVLGARLVEPFPVVYPPLARAALVDGNVEVSVTVTAAGAVESVSVVSGPPLLTKAAVESAGKSQYECAGCTGRVAITVVYSFVHGKELRQGCVEGTADSVELRKSLDTQTSFVDGKVVVKGPAFAICPGVVYAPVPKVRGARCVYLWKCRTPFVGVL